MNGILDFLRTLGPARLGAMGVMATILIGLFSFIIFQATAPQMVPLYTDLSSDDVAGVVAQLESQSIDYEVRDNETAVFVPEADVYRMRMVMAEAGLPTGGGVGYEIFDKTDTLGATSFVQNINHLRALEGELSRTIRSLGSINAARVHLVIPERQLFQRDRIPPTASIVLAVRGTLDAGQIRAIQHLVASAVEGLEPSYVSIVDERGALLASGTGRDEANFGVTALDDQAMAIENRLRLQIEEILNNVVGFGRARVQVSADLNFNRRTETKELFDPSGQVVRSTQTREETSSSRSGEDAVTVGNQLPNANPGAGGEGDFDQAGSSEEVINYEISKSTVTEVVEAGELERLSVAVLVDGTYQENESGEVVYTPRSEEQLEQIATLVRSAVGYNEERGDTVEIVNLQFTENALRDVEAVSGGLFEFTRYDIMRLIELGVLLVISVLLLIFAVNPLMKKILAPTEKGAEFGGSESTGGALVTTGPDGQQEYLAQLVDDSGSGGKAPLPPAEWIEDAKSEAALHANSIKEISDMIEELPSEAVNIVRGWLNEAA
ncbi:flagellar basal-body MS-ring/collar protein FliF [Pseudovibrio exalbescens]|uniref:flagellar basal-body MS-ring/collar protein FliF n=1 Tax=Pseudovibrio exalbescens TaxID=197461 RepID=UPI002365634F|nr:flagellar basal-body MS-ring/collar protein FliF [Pseudovibrio exalbescens]MDD7910147.1 flagellar basal-body MS-ring/collar protein FliF [Pseudovibrio exalbescens]